MNIQDLQDALEDAYNDLYDNPRPIHYAEIADRWDTDGLKETDMIADAINMACKDAENNRDRKDIDTIVQTLADWRGIEA